MLSHTRSTLMSLLRPLGASRLAELRPVLSMSVPLILSQAAQIGIMFIDSILMGRLGPDALAGGALALSTYFLCFVLAYGLTSAAGNLIALAHGRGDRRAVVAATRACFLMAFIMSVLIGIALWHAEPVMLALGQAPKTAHLAAGFLHILLWGMPLSMLFLTLRSFASGIGHPGPVPFITMSALLIAPTCGWVLSQGVGSWPGIGINGIAVSSVITYAYMGLAFGLVVLRNPVFACYKLFGAFERCDLKTIKPLLRLGFPTAGTMALESALFSTCAYLMGALGAADLAAHQSMFQLVMVSFIIPIGLTQGISMCVGQAAGAGEFDRVKHLGHLGQMMAVGWSLLTASMVLLAPNLLLALFLPEGRPGAQAARAIALSLTPLVALLLIFDAWQTVVNGILRALKDAHATLVIYSLGCWGVGIPLAWWLSRHGLGAVGVWVGMATGLACVSILLVWRFNHQTHALISGRKHL